MTDLLPDIVLDDPHDINKAKLCFDENAQKEDGHKWRPWHGIILKFAPPGLKL